MQKLIAILILFFGFVCSAKAQTYTNVNWGINRGSTPSPICVMNGSACLGQIGTLNIGTGAFSPSGGVGISGTPAATYATQWVDATTIKGVPQGVINVRTMYNAVPDGTTDNATAISNAFAAANAYSTGNVPTVYFDCDTGTSKCVYSYGGSGTSPINPTVPSTIMCAQGVSLKYTGTAHAVDLGPSGLTTPVEGDFTVQGCTFTGAASSTHGIFVRAFITNTKFMSNMFYNFGNRTGYNIYYEHDNWESRVIANTWFDDDGTNRNIMDAHNAAVNAIHIIGNSVECLTPPFSACSVVNIGVGFWIGGQAELIGNTIQYHGPQIRIANSSEGVYIAYNHLEGNNGSTFPMITYGNPGGTAAGVTCKGYQNNSMYSNPGGTTPIIGPETPSSGSYYLANCEFSNNQWGVPSGGAPLINTNGGLNNLWGYNFYDGSLITNGTTSPTVFDNNSRQYFVTTFKQGNGGDATALAGFSNNKQSVQAATYHQVSVPRMCSSGTSSATAVACNTTPSGGIDGINVTPVIGDEIIFKHTSTANTGAYTINVNSGGAASVKKCGGMDLEAGDITANKPVLLIFDGTNWQLSGACLPTNVQTLTDGATINWDMANGINAIVTLTASGHNLAAPTNVRSGRTYNVQIKQDATGSRTMTWDAAFKWGTVGTPTLTTTANAIDLVSCFASETTPTLLCAINKGY